jgi:hypothetical protein
MFYYVIMNKIRKKYKIANNIKKKLNNEYKYIKVIYILLYYKKASSKKVSCFRIQELEYTVYI